MGNVRGRKIQNKNPSFLEKHSIPKKEELKIKYRQTAREVCLELNSRKTTGLLPSLLLFLCGIEILFESEFMPAKFHTEVVALVSKYYPL